MSGISPVSPAGMSSTGVSFCGGLTVDNVTEGLHSYLEDMNGDTFENVMKNANAEEKKVGKEVKDAFAKFFGFVEKGAEESKSWSTWKKAGAGLAGLAVLTGAYLFGKSRGSKATADPVVQADPAAQEVKQA